MREGKLVPVDNFAEEVDRKLARLDIVYGSSLPNWSSLMAAPPSKRPRADADKFDRYLDATNPGKIEML